MKKVIVLFVFLFTAVALQPVYSFTSGELVEKDLKLEMVECSIQPDLSALIPMIENLGLQVEELEVVEFEAEDSCTFTIRGSYTYYDDEKDIERTITIEFTITVEGQSCGEFLRDVIKS